MPDATLPSSDRDAVRFTRPRSRHAGGSGVFVALAACGLAVGGAVGAAQAQFGDVDRDEQPVQLPTSWPDLPAIDGDFGDWPEGVYVLGDERYMALRFRLANPVSLDAAPGPITIRLDADDDHSTGRGVARMGVDLEIVFSDTSPTEDGRRRYGPTVRAFGSDGSVVELTTHEIGLEVAPTTASDWYEVRINRLGALDRVLKTPGIGANGRVWLNIETAGRGAVEPAQPIMWAPLPPDPVAVGGLEAELPAKPKVGLRVVSWNVLWGTPARDASPYARILEALKPDIILFQEWDRAETGEAEMAAWLNRHAGWATSGGKSWNAERSEAWGVAVASPYPIVARGPDELLAPGTRWDFPVRYAGAVIDTPLGLVAAASLHLKCCAGAGSDEDARRIVEAGAINREMASFADAGGAEFVVIGGDFNLNGTAAVLAIAGAGLDADGSELEIAQPMVLGDTVVSTFGRADRGSTGSRLDFITYPGSAWEVVSSFVLDTMRLDDASLEAMGLRRMDTVASDHRPVVVDLVPVLE
jgi:endonuclease/exonuclease/phosphatase family metal-dependent hydrolase